MNCCDWTPGIRPYTSRRSVVSGRSALACITGRWPWNMKARWSGSGSGPTQTITNSSVTRSRLTKRSSGFGGQLFVAWRLRRRSNVSGCLRAVALPAREPLIANVANGPKRRDRNGQFLRRITYLYAEIPSFQPDRALRTMRTNCSARVRIRFQSWRPTASFSTSALPTPRQQAPAWRNAAADSRSTPPVGMRRT